MAADFTGLKNKRPEALAATLAFDGECIVLTYSACGTNPLTNFGVRRFRALCAL